MQHKMLSCNHDCHSYISTFSCTFFTIKIEIASHKYSFKQMHLLQRVAVAALLSKTFVKVQNKELATAVKFV